MSEENEKSGTLIANLSTGKGTWGMVKAVIEKGNFEKVIVVTNDFGKERFTDADTMIVVNTFGEPEDIKKDILKQLPESDFGSEVALNMDSGSGKEHMALLSALIEKGYGFKFVTLMDDNLVYL